MSTPNETILIQIDIASNNQRLVELTKQLNENKQAQQDLAKAGKEGRISADELAAGQVRLRQQAADLTNETRVLTKANADQKKSNEASAGSINQLRAELAKGTAAYNALSEAERDNTEQGQKLQANNKMLSDSLKKLESAIGDDRRQVGGYKDAIKDAIKESGLFGGITDKLAEGQSKYAAAQKIVAVVTGETTGVTKALRIAFLAIPIFAVVAALGTLYAFLTKTAEGGRLVETAFAQVTATVNVVIDRLGLVGKAVSQLLKGQFSEAVSSAKAAYGGFVDEVQREVKLAGDLSKARQQLDRDTANNIDTNKRLLNEVERLKNVRDNEFNTVQQRQAANEKAYQIELTREKTLADLARRRIAILKAEINQRGGESKVSLEQLREYKEAQNELSDIQEDAAGKQNELITNRFQLTKELDDARTASIEADIAVGKTREDAAKAFLEQQLKGDQLLFSEKERLRKEKADADKASYDRDLAMLERNLGQRRIALETDKASGAVSQEQYNARLAVIDEGGFAARVLLAKHYNQDVAAAENAQAQNHNALLEKQTAKERAEYQERLDVALSFGQDVGTLLGQTLADANTSLEEFAGKVLVLILNSLEQFILAEQAKALARNVGTLGFAGLVTAGAEAALITTAFEAAKALITNASSNKQFHQGGLLNGASHAGGGIPFSVGGRLGFEAEGGEAIMTRGAVQQFAPLLSHLNVLGGGIAFATGGLVPGNPARAVAVQDGGFVARQLGGYAGPTAKEIAYELARVIPSEINVTTITNRQAKQAQVKGWATLGG